MANISSLPADLKDLARQMPDGLLGDLHQGEAEHRLRHVANMLEAAESLPAEQHRHVTARARKIRNAMPFAAYIAEHERLTDLKDDARRAGHHDMANAWREAVERLERDHEQAGGTAAVGQAMEAYDKANQDVSKAKPVSKAVERELARVQAEFLAKQAELRAEILAFREEMERRGQR